MSASALVSEPIACTWAEWIEQRHLKRLEINHISGDHRPLPRIGRDELLALYGCCDGFLSLQLEQLLLSHSRGPAAKIA